MLNIELSLPGETQSTVANGFKRARLDRKHSRSKASVLTGVPEATIRKFETLGQISFRQLVMLLHVYGKKESLLSLFPETVPVTMDELIGQNNKPKRQRGRS